MQYYIREFRAHHQESLESYRKQPTLHDAVNLAGLAVDDKGKRQRHQSRLPMTVLCPVRARLFERLDDLSAANTFALLIEIVEASSEPGFGELSVYDTALRIGSRLGITPDRVYLHAGTRKGAKALGLDAKAASLTREQLPQELNELTCDEVEDFLCIYKDEFRRIG